MRSPFHRGKIGGSGVLGGEQGVPHGVPPVRYLDKSAGSCVNFGIGLSTRLTAESSPVDCESSSLIFRNDRSRSSSWSIAEFRSSSNLVLFIFVDYPFVDFFPDIVRDQSSVISFPIRKFPFPLSKECENWSDISMRSRISCFSDVFDRRKI